MIPAEELARLAVFYNRFANGLDPLSGDWKPANSNKGLPSKCRALSRFSRITKPTKSKKPHSTASRILLTC